MYTVRARNINQAYVHGLTLLKTVGHPHISRNGNVLMANEPVTTHYAYPRERVLFDPERDANPFFHLLEGLWMLAGRNDVAPLAAVVPRMREYSDDGEILHGAYGHRWTEFAQLTNVISELRSNPSTRRAYIALWDPQADDFGDHQAKDLPCNVGIAFSTDVTLKKLNMTVFNRSNDILMGAYGANVVHFSMLLEYVASRAGLEVGWYEQVSNNFHAYTTGHKNFFDLWTKEMQRQDVTPTDPYTRVNTPVVWYPLYEYGTEEGWDAAWQLALDQICDAVKLEKELDLFPEMFPFAFLRMVVVPMFRALRYHKRKEPVLAVETLGDALERLPHCDWLVAGLAWLHRRYA